MSDTLLHRLEAVAHRLEQYAHKLGSAASSALHGGSSGAEASPASTAWTELESTSLAAFVTAANSSEDTKVFAKYAQTAFNHVGTLIAASSVSKKPTDAELMKFLEPVIAVINDSSKTPAKSTIPNHYKAFNEGITSVNWVVTAPPNGLPKDVAQNGVESADFWLIKVLKDGKTKGGAEGEAYSQFANTWKALLQAQVKFVVEFYRTGLEWNVKGASLSEYKASGSSSAAPSAVPPPPGPPTAPPAAPPASSTTSSSSGAVGLGAVFGELTTKDVTSGLRKVTNDMKTKNMKDKPVLEVKAPAAAAPAKAAPAAEKKEAKTYLSKGTWFVEYYEGGEVTLEGVQLKENVYIIKCKNTTVRIPEKCKSVQVDSCNRTQVEFKNIVSIFEIFNSQRISIFCTENCPSVAIDKSGGCSINLNRVAFANPPQIITSSVTELNLVTPGATDEDDPIEIPLPEQYITTYANGKISTEAVAHSAN